jgi:hypothetical protein
MNNIEYLEQKRLEVLKDIKPICEAFGIQDYDYEVSDKGQSETLRLNQTRIGCSCNSIFAIEQELIGYIFVKMWKDRSLGAFENQTKRVIKRYWLED